MAGLRELHRFERSSATDYLMTNKKIDLRTVRGRILWEDRHRDPLIAARYRSIKKQS